MIVHLFEKRDPTEASATVKDLITEVSQKCVDYKTLERQVTKVSASHKLIFSLLISQEMGFKYVEIEKALYSEAGALVGLSDLYIKDIDKVINIDGPRHYFNVGYKEAGKKRPLLGSFI
jgi:hypothetical protein